MIRRISLVACIVICVASSARGSIMTFASRAAFDAANPTAIIENWDAFAAGTTFANGSTVNGITYNSSTMVAVVTNAFVTSTSPNGLGRTPINFFDNGDTITFTFTTPVTAFGIDINTFATAAGSYTATTNLGDVALSVFDPFPSAPFGTGQFVGFTSDTPFASVTIAEVTGFTYTLDTLRRVPSGSTGAIPEPYALLVWGGLAACASIYARRKSCA
jgi:hypothetical protein